MPKKATIGATDSKLKVTFPEGFPQALLVRGVGQALYDKLEELGEPCQGLNGVILLHVEAETERVLGPRFYLRGEPVTIAITPKNIWGEGTKGEICHVERSGNNPFVSIPGHSVELSVNPNVFEFPGTGEHRLLSAWVDMFPSPEVKYLDKNNKVVTKLKNTKGA